MMEIISNIIYYVIPFIVLLGILVFVHEFGHFIVARMLKVKVVAFSIGFGKVLWSRTDSKGTEWKLSAIPLGGYCQFLGDGDASSSTADQSLNKLSAEEKSQAFALQSTWKKILIVVAGPLFNYALAILLFIILFAVHGQAVIPSYVGTVMPDSAAQRAGVMVGDKIVSLNGNPTPDFWTLARETDLATNDPVAVEVERSNTIRLAAADISYEPCDNLTAGKAVCITARAAAEGESDLPVVAATATGSTTEEAGLQAGDILDTINGVELSDYEDFRRYISSHPDEEFEIKYHRNIMLEAYLQDSILEDVIGGSKRRMLGVVSSPEYTFTQKMDLAKAIPTGAKEAYDITMMTLRGVWQMITGHRGSKEIGGIIRIAEMSGDASKKGGLSGFVYFMALISVNLGLINLFPIPVLDGGNLVIYLIEIVIRRELKPAVKDYIFKLGLGILLAIMVLATWNDISHLVSRWFY